LAGTGDLVATVLAPDSRNRRAGEMLAEGVAPSEIGTILGQVAEAVECVPLLAQLARDVELKTPAIDNLTALIEGRIEPLQWAATVTEPARSERSAAVRAA